MKKAHSGGAIAVKKSGWYSGCYFGGTWPLVDGWPYAHYWDGNKWLCAPEVSSSWREKSSIWADHLIRNATPDDTRCQRCSRCRTLRNVVDDLLA